MRPILTIAAGGAAILASYLTGVNNGYDLGADTMQCFTYSMLTTRGVLTDKSIAEDACITLKQWMPNHPAYMLRVAWIEATGQGIPTERPGK